MSLFSVILAFSVYATPNVDLYCGARTACALLYEDNPPHVVIREAGEFSGLYELNISVEGIDFPHFQSGDERAFMRCGVEIAERAGLPIPEMAVNLYASLCHETKHAIMGPSHNQ